MPIFSAIATGIGSILGGFSTFLAGGTFLAGITKFGLSLAAQFALGALFPQQRASQAVKSEVQYGTNLAREVVLGTVGTAGHHIFRNASGKGNRYVRDIVVLSNFKIQGVERIRLDGKWVTLGPPDGGGYRTTGNGSLRMLPYLGSLSQTADPSLITDSKPAGRWTVNHRGAGQSYLSVWNKLDQETLPSPWEPFAEVIGPKLYDWRKDSTVGGSGADRWNNQDTWSGRHDNPILQMYALERGIFQNGELIVGKGASVSRLPLDRWTLAANICDEAVAGKPRYSASIIAKAGPGVTHASNMEPLLAACAASWIDGPDGEYPMVGVNQAVAATITDADLMPDEPYRFSLYRPRSELVNTVAGTYCDPENFFESSPLAVRNLASAVIQDGERIAVSISYDAVTDPAQCDRLTDIQLRANRYQANGEICVHPKFIGVKVGQWIRWNSATRGDRKFQVLKRRLGPVGETSYRNVYWTVQEVSDGIFDPTAFATNPPIPVVQGAPDYQTELDEFQLNPVIVVNPDGIERAGFKALWLELEDPSVTMVEFRYWPTNQPDAVFYQRVSADVLTTTIVNSIVSRTEYAFQYRLHASPPRPMVWTAVITRLAPETTQEFYPIDPSEILGQLGDLMKEFGNSIRDVEDQLASIDAHAASIALQAFSNVQTVRQEVASTFGDATARFTSEILAATGPDSAIVRRIDEFNVSLAGKASISALQTIGLVTTSVGGVITGVGSAVTSITAQLPGKANITALQSIGIVTTDGGGAITGVGSAITGIEAQISGVTASGLFRVQAGGTPGPGFGVRMGMEGRLTTANLFRAAGFYIDVSATAARTLISADQVAIIAGGVVSAMFDAGTAYIAVARIRNLDAGNIRAKSIDANAILQNGTLITDLIAAAAVTNTVANSASSGVLSAGYNTIVTATLPVARAASTVLVQVTVVMGGSANITSFGPDIRILRNGTAIFTQIDVTRTPRDYAASFIMRDLPGATGSAVYSVQVSGVSPTFGSVQIKHAGIVVTELKK